MHILDELLYQAGMGLAACPTAPGCEDFVRSYLENALRGLPHVRVRRDEFGNLIAHYRHKARGREAVRLVAHMDHPAFVVQGRELHFRGGVEERYFLGEKVIFHGATERELGEAVIVGTDFFREAEAGAIERTDPGARDLRRLGPARRRAARSGFSSARPATISRRWRPCWRCCNGWRRRRRPPRSRRFSPARRRSAFTARWPR